MGRRNKNKITKEEEEKVKEVEALEVLKPSEEVEEVEVLEEVEEVSKPSWVDDSLWDGLNKEKRIKVVKGTPVSQL